MEKMSEEKSDWDQVEWRKEARRVGIEVKKERKERPRDDKQQEQPVTCNLFSKSDYKKPPKFDANSTYPSLTDLSIARLSGFVS